MGVLKAQFLCKTKEVDEANRLLLGLARLAKYALDVQQCLSLFTLVAWNEMNRGRFKDVMNYCELVSLLNSHYQYERQEIEALKLLALCQIKLQEYKPCVRTLKLCLEQAFRVEDRRVEMFCYGKLALCYFYLGNLELTKYFKHKQDTGMCEHPDSRIR